MERQLAKDLVLTVGYVGSQSYHTNLTMNTNSAPIREGVTLRFRAEAFNVLNHANFAFPNQIVFQGNSSNYSLSESAGEITNTATPSRQIQFALKLLF